MTGNPVGGIIYSRADPVASSVGRLAQSGPAEGRREALGCVDEDGDSQKRKTSSKYLLKIIQYFLLKSIPFDCLSVKIHDGMFPNLDPIGEDGLRKGNWNLMGQMHRLLMQKRPRRQTGRPDNDHGVTT